MFIFQYHVVLRQLFTCHVILCNKSLQQCSFCILLFNVLASFNLKVMDVHRSFPYFSKVKFHVVYFFDRLWILTSID